MSRLKAWFRIHPWEVGAAVLILGMMCLNTFLGAQPWFPDALSEGLHLRYEAMAYEAVSRSLQEGPQWADLTYQGFPYGPFTYVGAALLEHLLGRSPWVLLLFVNLCASAALLFTFLIGRDLWDARAGFLSALLLAAYPMSGYYSRRFTTVMPVMAFSMAIIWILPRTRRLRHPGWVVALGLAYGLGLLVKVNVLHFTFFPVLAWLVMEASAARREGLRGQPWGRIILGALVAAALAGGLAYAGYYHHFGEERVQGQIEAYRLGVGAAFGIEPIIHYPGKTDAGWWYWATFYLRMLPEYQLTLPLTLAAVLGILAGLRRGDLAMRKVCFWLLGGFALWTALVVKKWYYTVPLLPLLALVTAGGLAGMNTQLRRRLEAAGAILVLATMLHSPGAAWRPWQLPLTVFNDPPLLVATRGFADPPGERFARLLQQEISDGALRTGIMLSIGPIKKRYIPGYQTLYSLEHQLSWYIERWNIPIWLEFADTLPLVQEHFRESSYAIFAAPNHPDGSAREWLEGNELPLWSGDVVGGTPEALADVVSMSQELDLIDRVPVGAWTVSLYRINHFLDHEHVEGASGF